MPRWAAVILLLLIIGAGLQVAGKLLFGNDHAALRWFVLSGIGLHFAAAVILLVVLRRFPKSGPVK